MLSNTQKTFLFAFGMCVFCSFLLSGMSVGLKDRQEKNVLIDKQKNVLKALGVLDSNVKYSGLEIENLYQQNVKSYFVDSEGDLTEDDLYEPVFVLGEKSNIKAYAVPFEAYGLWSWVKGYIAINNDGNTIVGMTVYEHAETPGLGGEVEKKWFQDQFIGKKITDNNGQFVSIGVVKGKVADSVKPDQYSNYVDGMSGATITGKGLEKYLKIDLEKYEKFSENLRNKST